MRSAEAYVAFAEDYYERSFDKEAVAAVLGGAALTHHTVAALSAAANFEAIAAQARVLGHMVQEELAP
jgi:hypothetical protein